MRTFLVPIDFSAASDRALEEAQRLALALGAEIHLFHKVVYPAPHPPTELLDRLDDVEKFDYVLKEVLEKPEREAREELERRRRKLSEAGVPVVVHLERSGDVFERIEAAIETLSPDLIIMGTHGRSGVKKWLLGSLAEKVLRHTSIDLLAVHADAPLVRAASSFGEILVATDFSDCARRALDLGFRLASDVGATVAVVHVIDRPFLPRDNEAAAELLDLSHDLEERSRKALRAELGGREGEALVADGRAAEQIGRLARERASSLVVVGTHGRSGIADALIGSVAEKVVRSCRTPVLVVR
jgi:nucleotide-binding universal stress UspA family protein